MSELNNKDTELKKENKDKKSSKPAKKKQNKTLKWFKELKAEAKKVVWPTRHAVLNNTGVVLSTVLMALVVIAGLDFVFKFISHALISLG